MYHRFSVRCCPKKQNNRLLSFVQGMGSNIKKKTIGQKPSFGFVASFGMELFYPERNVGRTPCCLFLPATQVDLYDLRIVKIC